MQVLTSSPVRDGVVGAGLAAAEERLRRAVAAFPKPVGVVADEMLRRGKRLRPLVLLLSAEACGGYGEAALQLATATELVHMASVVHDDVIDGTTLRRGVPAARLLLGNRLAVLLGDLLVSVAWRQVLDSGVAEATRVLTTAVSEMVVAQVEELSATGTLVGEGQYLRIVAGKTAALFEAAAGLGALSAGGSPEEYEGLTVFAHHLGMAFQISDDLLDLFGDPLALGKDTGSDLLAGVYTLPVIYASHADENRLLPPLLRTLRESQQRNGSLASAVALIRSLGGEHYARERVERHCARAREALQVLPASPAREALSDLTSLILDRRA